MSQFIYHLPEQKDLFIWGALGLTILLGLFFLMISFKNFRNDPAMCADFKRWNYSETFRRTVAFWQLSGGVLLLTVIFSYLGAVLLSVLMLGAIYTHLKFDPPKTAIVPLVFFIFLGWIIFILNPIL